MLEFKYICFKIVTINIMAEHLILVIYSSMLSELLFHRGGTCASIIHVRNRESNAMFYPKLWFIINLKSIAVEFNYFIKCLERNGSLDRESHQTFLCSIKIF